MSRTALLLAGASALLPLAAIAASGQVAGAPEAERFVAPTGPTTLTRSVRRVLADGKEVVSSRTYALRFVREGEGYRVEGSQVDCTVDAPAALAALAEVERKRVDAGLFPLRLDAFGRIVDSSAKGDAASRREAAAKVSGRVSASALGAGDKVEAQGFVAGLVERGGAQAVWPADLFVAARGERNETRRLALPGGGEGTVTVATRAAGDTGVAAAATFERIVTTELGISRNVVRELFTLKPA